MRRPQLPQGAAACRYIVGTLYEKSANGKLNLAFLISLLLGIINPEQVSQHPLVGSIFENLIVSEMLKGQLNRGRKPNFFSIGIRRDLRSI